MAKRKTIDPFAVLESAAKELRESYGHAAAFEPEGCLSLRGRIGHFGFRLCECGGHLHVFFFERGSEEPPDGDESIGAIAVEADGATMAGTILMTVASFFLVALDENTFGLTAPYVRNSL